MMIDLAVLNRELEAARKELHNLQVMALRPDQSPERLAMLRRFEVSARAEVKLRQKALQHYQSRAPSP
jgi:hypothetical protein